MASYRGHLMFSTTLGAAYGSLGVYQWNYDWGEAFLGAGLAAVGGMLPDLDSDSGVPVRELFGLAASVTPLLLYPLVHRAGFTPEQTFVLLAGVYLAIRYAVANVFRRCTVHRGMYHSIPAMLIAGLVVYLSYHSPNLTLRLYLSVGTMLGFLSHLVLDELCSVDFMGVTLRLNKYAGSAVKFFSPSWPATLACYALLVGLGYLAWQDWSAQGKDRLRWTTPRTQLTGGGSGRPALGGGP